MYIVTVLNALMSWYCVNCIYRVCLWEQIKQKFNTIQEMAVNSLTQVGWGQRVSAYPNTA